MDSNWFKLWPTAYLNVINRIPDGTQRGEFLLLAFHCLNDGGLPDSDDEIAFNTGLSVDRVTALRPYLNRLATVENGRLMIQIVSETIQERQEFARKKAASGKLGGQYSKAGNSNGKPSEAKPSKSKQNQATVSTTKQDEAKPSHTDIQTYRQYSEKDKSFSGADAPPDDVSRPADEPNPPGKAPDPCYAAFTAKYSETYGLPYGRKNADFVHLANLRRRLGERFSAIEWGIAVANYFNTPQSSHTLADLATRYATFHRSALDRYQKPVTVTVHSSKPERGVVY